MKILHLGIVAISCFCAIDFIFIQSNFFIPCGWQSIEYSAMHPVPCNDMVQILQSIFGMAASIGIAAIVGVSALFSPKKSVLIVVATAGLYILFIVIRQILFLSANLIPPGIMQPITLSERMLMTFVRSPVWSYVLAAAIFSSIIWPIVVLRKKITGVLR
jgi:hypothetical protein